MMMSDRRMASLAAAVRSSAAVPDDALEAHFDAELVQFFGEVERIGVLTVGREHLRAHGDGFGVHGVSVNEVSSGARCRRVLRQTRVNP